MADTGTVTPSGVRTALNEADATEFPESTVAQKLSDAEGIVEHHLSDEELADLDQGIYEMAVRDLAAYRVWMASPAEMKRAALELTVTYDVQTFTNRLRDQRDAALARIGITNRGTSAGIADHTDGVW